MPRKPKEKPKTPEVVALGTALQKVSPAGIAQLLVDRLPTIYPEARCELYYSNPLELLIATMLSAQCTDVQVNKVTPALFAAFATASDYAQASQEAIERLVQSAGFYRNKARNIRLAAQEIAIKHGGHVPQTLAELVALPGVGRKTANVVLGNAFNINEGIVVDTHVGRLSRRFKLTEHLNPEKVEADLIPLIPQADWTIFSHWLIFHGRRRCFARKPDCLNCELADFCPSFCKV